MVSQSDATPIPRYDSYVEMIAELSCSVIVVKLFAAWGGAGVAARAWRAAPSSQRFKFQHHQLIYCQTRRRAGYTSELATPSLSCLLSWRLASRTSISLADHSICGIVCTPIMISRCALAVTSRAAARNGWMAKRATAHAYSSISSIDVAERTSRLLAAKADSGLTYDELSKKLGVTNTYAAQLLLGQAKLTKDTAAKLQEALPSVSAEDVKAMVSAFPMRSFDDEILKEPNVYRTYEAITHYGEAIKSIINEQCGDGPLCGLFRALLLKPQHLTNASLHFRNHVSLFESIYLPPEESDHFSQSRFGFQCPDRQVGD